MLEADVFFFFQLGVSQSRGSLWGVSRIRTIKDYSILESILGSLIPENYQVPMKADAEKGAHFF